MSGKTGLFAALLAALLMSFGTVASSAGSLQEKLELCKKEFARAHDQNVPQKEALDARIRHLQLMKELLRELNEKNVDRKMTSEEIQENLMVVSHLLEMMVTEDLANKMRDMELSY